MKQELRSLVVGIVAATSLGFGGCGPSTASSGGDDGEGETEPGPGPDPMPVATCAAACSTDLDAARTALTSGDYPRAFELYRCADSPEAAFGAGLTRTLLAFDGNNADAVLADFGEPPLPSSDIFGENGLLGRTAARWNGDGNLTVTGGVNVALPFDRAMHEVSEDIEYSIGTFNAEDRTSPANARFTLSFDNEPGAPAFTSGSVLAITNACSTTFSTTTLDSRLGYLDLEFDIGETNYFCEFPYSLPPEQCQADGGSIVVTAAATAPGQPASYQLDNVLLDCYPSTSGDVPPDSEAPEVFVRVSGSLSARAVSERLDTTGLHPMLGDGYSVAAHIPAGKTLTDVMQHGGAAFAELEEAACFFKIAGQGTGHIYDLPGVVFGGSDVAFSKGDTEVVAAFALFGAAAGHLAWVHEMSMPLDKLVCESDEPAGTVCPTQAEYVALFNSGFSSRFHPGRLLIVERLSAEALALLDKGISDLDASSLLVRNGVSAAGLDALRPLLQASLQSIQEGELALPRVTPGLNVNLRALFENPRDPKSVGPILKYQEECEGDECSTSTEIDSAFLDRYFAGRIDADWEGEYEWADSDVFGEAASEVGDNVSRHALVPFD